MNFFRTDVNASTTWNGSGVMVSLATANLRTVSATDILLVSLFSLLGVFICGGNLLTIVAVYRTKELRTTPNSYIVSLAWSDVLTGITFPLYISSTIPFVSDTLDSSQLYCTFRYGWLYMLISESFLCILAIAVDRFLYIMYPLRYHTILTRRRTLLVIFGTWVLSVTVGMLTVFTSTWPGHCSFFHVLTSAFQLFVVIPYMASIFIIVAVLYGIITRQALRQRQRIRVCGSPGPSLNRYRSRFRSLRLFILVYAVFALCWFPSGIVVVIGYKTEVGFMATSLCLSLGMFNSGLNFFVYAFMNRDFKRAFLKIVTGVCVCCRICL